MFRFLLIIFLGFSYTAYANVNCIDITDASNEGGCQITAMSPYAGGYGKMQLKVYSNGEGRKKYDKPIVAIAPYPISVLTGEGYSGTEIEDYMDTILIDTFHKPPLAQILLSTGLTKAEFTDKSDADQLSIYKAEILSMYGDSDIFLFAYSEGRGVSDYVQRNALAVLEGIQLINQYNNASISILGTSLGGLMAKYTLGYANANNIDLNVRSYAAIDSPLRGANVPLSIQYLPIFFDGMVNDFENIGHLSMSDVGSILVYAAAAGLSGLVMTLPSFEIAVLTESRLDDMVEEEFSKVRSQYQLTYENIQSTSSKQLFINHVNVKGDGLRSDLINELDGFNFETNLKTAVFTNTNNFNIRYPTPSADTSRTIIRTYYNGTASLKKLFLHFQEAVKGDGADYTNLFNGKAVLDRPGDDDVFKRDRIQLKDYTNYKYHNNVSGTHISTVNNIVELLNSQALYGSEQAWCNLKRTINGDQVCQEPTFIPSYSALDIDPNKYGYNLEYLGGKTVEEVSPFDEVYSLNSERHLTMNYGEQIQLRNFLKNRHDLAFLVAVNSLVLH